jgi:hypothetical protein
MEPIDCLLSRPALINDVMERQIVRSIDERKFARAETASQVNLLDGTKKKRNRWRILR